jgi:hypothetical protein
MQIGIDSFVASVPEALTGANLHPADRLNHLLEEIALPRLHSDGSIRSLSPNNLRCIDPR